MQWSFGPIGLPGARGDLDDECVAGECDDSGALSPAPRACCGGKLEGRWMESFYVV